MVKSSFQAKVLVLRPQFRKKSQNKINFFKVREKSGNFSLIQGKFTALGEIGEK